MQRKIYLTTSLLQLNMISKLIKIYNIDYILYTFIHGYKYFSVHELKIKYNIHFDVNLILNIYRKLKNLMDNPKDNLS